MEEQGRSKGKEAIQSSSHAKEFKYHVFLSSFGYDTEAHHIIMHGLKRAGLSVAEGSTDGDLDFFSPTRCLDELAKMNECRRKTSGQIVLPIFDRIKPSDVQNQAGPYNRFQMSGIGKKNIERLKEALTEIGSLKGCTVNGNSYESCQDAVKEIVDQVINLLVNEASLDNNLVGIEQSRRSIVEMLYNASDYRRVLVSGSGSAVGICGMPGIGKTTLARVLYNSLHGFYEGCSFVSNIQQRSEKEGLHSLQVQLIKELLNTDDHIYFRSFEDHLKAEFSNTKVLIVLDGVECLDHIKAFGVGLGCFGYGSRIILTTREPELLVEAGVCDRYFLEELDKLQALKLFCKHTFQKDSPEEEYRDLSAEIASSTRGIPSVIKSVGSYLSNYKNKEKEKWEEVLQQLRSSQYEPLKELLRLSHDFLSKGRWHFYPYEGSFHVEKRDGISHYDVVLCFDARDRVKNLVESLHKRMESFDVGIFALNGDYMRVNETGKIFIPVISRSYASNSSCLEMLVHMAECTRSSATNHILPIYHAIEPSEIYLLAPLYESCNEWSIPETFRLCREEDIRNLTDSVCQMVLHKIKLNQSIMGNHLVGIDRHMKSILELLNLEVNDVRIVAISGEDGAGKTTLAKVVHDRLSSNFEGCSFLTEIDERTQHYDGVKCMQAQMISDLLNMDCEVYDSVIEGINLIKERFQSMKVLIILDDVTESFHVEALVGQLNWFGPGSRVIIATKHASYIPLPHVNYNILHYEESAFDIKYELFCKKACSGYKRLPNFTSLSREIVDLPFSFLTIEIVGSLLCEKDEAEWEYVLGNLRSGVDLNVLLKMSFDSLNEMQKEIFLDISCFPNGMDGQIAMSLWYNSVHSISSDIEELICLFLVKVDAKNKISMHRLFKNFGREIVDQKRKDTVEKDEDRHLPIKLPALDFEMANIRYLKLDNAIIRGSRDCFYMRQRDLIWKWCPLDLLATLNARCLKVLDMSWSKVTEEWEGWKQIKVPQLRVLNLRDCGDLMVTPTFSFCPYLEILILEKCSRLVKIDPSIGTLRHLTILNLRNCHELSMLPEEVGCLTDLGELSLDGTPLQEIPSSIGLLKKLRFLTPINCSSLSRLPNSIHDLQFITVIKLDFTNITGLPISLGERLKLRHLSLRGCRGIRRLSPLVGEVERSLVELDVSETSISELPKSIVRLQALRVLKMEFCFIKEFPPSFGELKKLEEIHASRCRNLKSLPNDIGELKSLRILILRHTCIFNVPESICRLQYLRTLDCTSCDELQNLPELPFGLISLHVESKKLKVLPYFSRNMKGLEEFTFVSGDIGDLPDVSMASKSTTDFLHWQEMLGICFQLRTLRLCLPQIRHLPYLPQYLKILRLFCCRKLEHMPPLPPIIIVLSIQDCASLREMPNVESLEHLQEVEILRCPEIKKIEGLEGLKAMRVLTISGSGVVSLSGLDKLTSLVRLNISRSLRESLDISTLKGVSVHWLSNADNSMWGNQAGK